MPETSRMGEINQDQWGKGFCRRCCHGGEYRVNENQAAASLKMQMKVTFWPGFWGSVHYCPALADTINDCYLFIFCVIKMSDSYFLSWNIFGFQHLNLDISRLSSWSVTADRAHLERKQNMPFFKNKNLKRITEVVKEIQS